MLNIITGRNEVVAKVIFLHLSVIHSVHRGGGGLPQCMLGYPPGADTPPRSRPPPPPQEQTPRSRHPPPREQTPLEQTSTPPEQTPPPRPDISPLPEKQTPAYGLRAAGTHPTGMHSCSMMLFLEFNLGHRYLL